jgi:hypothetical protein
MSGYSAHIDPERGIIQPDGLRKGSATHSQATTTKTTATGFGIESILNPNRTHRLVIASIAMLAPAPLMPYLINKSAGPASATWDSTGLGILFIIGMFTYWHFVSKIGSRIITEYINDSDSAAEPTGCPLWNQPDKPA